MALTETATGNDKFIRISYTTPNGKRQARYRNDWAKARKIAKNLDKKGNTQITVEHRVAQHTNKQRYLWA